VILILKRLISFPPGVTVGRKERAEGLFRLVALIMGHDLVPQFRSPNLHFFFCQSENDSVAKADPFFPECCYKLSPTIVNRAWSHRFSRLPVGQLRFLLMPIPSQRTTPEVAEPRTLAKPSWGPRSALSVRD
jgi:hypothetical protein